MTLNVYLSGEIHTDWREQIIEGARSLEVTFTAPVTDHAKSMQTSMKFKQIQAETHENTCKHQ